MKKLLMIVILGLLVSACGAGAEGPPDLVVGRDVCDRCGMIISEPRFASGYWVGEEDWLFDDIGGMMVFASMSGDIESMSAWVHDYDSEEWMKAEDASYVMEPSIQTPMAFGIAAFDDEERATEFAAEHSTSVITWEELVATALAGEIEPSGGHMSHSDG